MAIKQFCHLFLYRTIIINKRQIIASLNNIANSLDNSGLFKEANTITKVMIKLAQEDKMKTKYSDDELNEAMSEQGIQTAFEAYKSKGGSASQDSFASLWKPLIERMLNGFTNNMGVSIAEEKYKRKNPYWDPRD